MNHTIRRIAVSGSAAVALLGGAAAITTATADTASATEIRTAVDRATGAPVTMPDGRTVHVRGLDSAAYRADASHRTAVVQLAGSGTQPGGTAGMGESLNGPTPQGGVGQQLQQPVGYNPQQIQTQAGGAALGTGTVLALVLGIVLFFGIKGGKVSKGWAFASMSLGVVLAGTFVGPLVTQLGGTGVSAFGNIFGGL